MASEDLHLQPDSMEQTSDSNVTVFLDEEEDFATLFEESSREFKEHQIVTGKVIAVHKDLVTVDIGYKSEGQIDIAEFQSEEGGVAVQLGDEVEVFLEAMEDANGIVVLSKEKAEKLRIWQEVGRIYEEERTVEGVISARIKGGLSVDLGIKAFLPGSQVDLRPVRNLEKLIGERFEFKILKFNQKRGNIVLSRRALLEVDREARRKKTLAVLTEGALIKGFVKNITDYGVFIDLGGVDGLLHITDMTWGRIVHPSEMFTIGDEVDVVVLKFDAKEEKVSLGIKQKQENPWSSVEEKYPVGSRVQGKIVSLTDYGAFIELEPGVEGLIHVTEMSWTRKVRHPSKILSLAQEVEVVVKGLDVERKRISLSLKEAEPNPWETIHLRYPIGSLVAGKVRNITDFGIFVGLEEGIDGLVHISDLSWSQRQRKPSAFAKKGDEIEVKILHIDPEKERLSLGIKQLTEDPWRDLEDKIGINDEIIGRIVNVTDFGIFVEVMEGVEGLAHISELDPEIPKDNLEQFYQVGGYLRAKVIKMDMDERRLGLGVIGIVEPPPGALEHEEALRDALAEPAPEGAEEAAASDQAPAEAAAPEEAPPEKAAASDDAPAEPAAPAKAAGPEDAPAEAAAASNQAPAEEAAAPEEAPAEEAAVPEEVPAEEAAVPEEAPAEEAAAAEPAEKAKPKKAAASEEAPAEEAAAAEPAEKAKPKKAAATKEAPAEEAAAAEPAEKAKPKKATRARKPKAEAAEGEPQEETATEEA